MSGDRLRETAATLREAAEWATPGPWTLVGSGEYIAGPGVLVAPDDGGVTDLDARYIALMDPRAGAALADWLDLAADDHDAGCPSDCPASRIADLILGGEGR